MLFLNYYEILDVPWPKATQEEIRAAYIRKIWRLRGEKQPPFVTRDTIQQYHQAYLTLSDEKEKKTYDEVLSLHLQWESTQGKREIEIKRTPVPENKTIYTAVGICFTVLALLVALGYHTQSPSTLVSPTSPAPVVLIPAPPKVEAQTTNRPLVEVPRPINGKVFKNTGIDSDSVIEVETLSGTDYLVKMTGLLNQNLEVIFFVRGGERVEIPVQSGTYILKYACGKTWYGIDSRFGPETEYQRAINHFTFTDTEGWTIELYIRPNGNMTTREISEEDF